MAEKETPRVSRIFKELRMILESVRAILEEIAEEGLLYENPSYDNSIIGVSNGRVVYDLDQMVEEYKTDNNCSYEEAIEFIEYNTLRANPYYDMSPIVVEGMEMIKECK